MTEKQAREILYLLWYNGYLDPNFTEPHTEYEAAVCLLMNPKKEIEEWTELYG